jgi:prephenate dehydratase
MRRIKVAYLGPKKTYTETAAQLMFPNAELIPLTHIKRVLLAVEENQVNYGVVPFENIHNGKVIGTLDALTNYAREAEIIKEVAIPIVHCIGALKGHDKITQILSKDQALEQCETHLNEFYPEAEPVAVASTTFAVQRIIQENLVNAAAIASKKGLDGLEVLAEDICPNNKTRFFALGKYPTKPSGDDKTFLSFHPYVTDEAGVLYNCLSPLKLFNINMADIFSRPDKNPKQRNYHFFIELNGHQNDFLVRRAIEDLKIYLDPQNKYPDSVRVFGSYPNSHWDESQET